MPATQIHLQLGTSPLSIAPPEYPSLMPHYNRKVKLTIWILPLCNNGDFILKLWQSHCNLNFTLPCWTWKFWTHDITDPSSAPVSANSNAFPAYAYIQRNTGTYEEHANSAILIANSVPKSIPIIADTKITKSHQDRQSILFLYLFLFPFLQVFLVIPPSQLLPFPI